MLKTLMLLGAAILAGCAAPPPHDEPVAGEQARLHAGPPELPPLPHDGISDRWLLGCPDPPPGDLCNWVCSGLWPNGHPPTGCLCVNECPPPSGPCKAPGCDGVIPPGSGTCIEVQRAPGIWCASGVGTCDAAGNCVLPQGVCDPVGPTPIACAKNSDCFDNNPCTLDLCLGAWCANEPLPDGKPCVEGGAKACHAGMCCQ